jgi:hypothetical protein
MRLNRCIAANRQSLMSEFQALFENSAMKWIIHLMTI